MPRIVLVGTPGSGKSTQMRIVAEKYGVVPINVGDLLRAEVAKGTELGNPIKEAMDTPAALVPDEIVAKLVEDRIKQPDCVEKGFVLRGYPRTKRQGELLDAAGIKIDACINIDVPTADDVLQRVQDKFVDPETGNTYAGDAVRDLRDDVKERLQRRADSTREAIEARAEACRQQAAEVRDFFGGAIFRTIDAAGKGIDAVKDGVDSALDSIPSVSVKLTVEVK